MTPDLLRLIALLLVLALVVPGALSMARGSQVPVFRSLLVWGGLLALLALGYDWWQDWNSDVTGPARLE